MVHTECYLSEFLSVAGQFASYNAHELAKTSIYLTGQTHPQESMAYFPKSTPQGQDKRKMQSPKKQEKILIKPGQESHMALPDLDVLA